MRRPATYREKIGIAVWSILWFGSAIAFLRIFFDLI